MEKANQKDLHGLNVQNMYGQSVTAQLQKSGGVTSCNPCHTTVLEGNDKLSLSHPEFISGSKDPIFKMLKRVQHDENWTKTACHSEFISESKKFVKNAWFSTESKNIIKQTLKQVQGDVNCSLGGV